MLRIIVARLETSLSRGSSLVHPVRCGSFSPSYRRDRRWRQSLLCVFCGPHVCTHVYLSQAEKLSHSQDEFGNSEASHGSKWVSTCRLPATSTEDGDGVLCQTTRCSRFPDTVGDEYARYGGRDVLCSSANRGMLPASRGRTTLITRIISRRLHHCASIPSETF